MTRTAILLGLVALLAGCGGTGTAGSSEDFEGVERVVAVAVEDLQEAAAEDQPERICDDLFAAPLRETFARGGRDCAESVAVAIDDADAFELGVEDVTVRGDRATVRVTSRGRGDDETESVALVREGRVWRLASLGDASTAG